MPAEVLSRQAEVKAVADFLTAACCRPSALMMRANPASARPRCGRRCSRGLRAGFRVLSARGAEAESVLAHAALADLLAGVDPAELAGLPQPQRVAIDRITLRANVDEASNQHAVSAAFLSVLRSLSQRSPVLVAIDDLQWLDPSSAQVLAFAARRLGAGGRPGHHAQRCAR